MNKLFALGVVALGVASAANTGPSNLKGVRPCFTVNSVQIDNNLTSVAPEMASEIEKVVFTKLRAYRVPFTPTCSLLQSNLYIQVDGFKTSQGIYAYSINADLFDKQTFPGIASIWSTGTYGVTGQVGRIMSADFAESVGDLIDEFAADYATANP